MSKNVGFDYGIGQSNIDHETGIRYGVISQHSVMPEALDDVEYDYGKPSCPKCGEEVEPTPKGAEFIGQGDCEYYCEQCSYGFDEEEAHPEQPLGWSYEKEGYVLVDCLDTDVMVIKSPFYTHAQFCSPCVPGAGNLDNPLPPIQHTAETCPGRPCSNECDHVEYVGVKAYALGHDWFEGGVAPYPVYKVSDGSVVEPE